VQWRASGVELSSDNFRELVSLTYTKFTIPNPIGKVNIDRTRKTDERASSWMKVDGTAL
jgi:hypothetical protein